MKREFLLTKLVCAECGNVLSLTYDKPKCGNDFAQGEPSGAAIVAQAIFVEPCETCMRPLAEMKAAARVLLSA